MDINQIKPNTDSYREAESQDDAINNTKKALIKGKAHPNYMRSLTNRLIPDDLDSLGDRIIDEFANTLSHAAADMVYGLVDAIFPDARRTRGNSGSVYRYSGDTRKYSNNTRRDRDRDDRDSGYRSSGRRKFDYHDVTAPTKREAEEVIMGLQDAINGYGIVTVATFYDMCDMEHDYTDEKYGWTDVSTAEVVPCRDGWLIKLPKALPID